MQSFLKGAARAASCIISPLSKENAGRIMAKGLIASLFGAFIVSCSGCGGGGGGSAAQAVTAVSASSPAPVSAPLAASQPVTTPEADYRAIAQATLPTTATADQLAAREDSVKQFIASNGGDSIYQNYLAEYGINPDARLNYYANTTNVSSPHLGYYYLTRPLTSAADTIYFDCTKTSTAAIQASPTIQAFCAISQWDAYILTGDTSHAQALVTAADSLINSSVNGQLQWTSRTVPAFGITTTPWTSALTQSVAISVFLRAFQYTGRQQYMTAATAAYYWLTVPVSQGGLQTTDIGLWLEEYPNRNQNAISGHVLNGDMWALFGVWDYYRVTGDANAKALFDTNAQSIKNNVSKFDIGYWSIYSTLNNVDMLDGMYMQFVVQQLYAMNAITQDEAFKSIGDKWGADQETDALFVHNMASEYLKANPS